jgi:hypothetical protein
VATARRSARRLEPLPVSQAIARCGRSPRISPTRRVSTCPGPVSTKTRAPAAYIASICGANSTGRATCAASCARTAAGVDGYGAASTLLHTGTDGARTSTVARCAASAASAPATSGLWNAAATAMRRAVMPAAPSAATARSIAAAVPASTHCRGLLRLAITAPVSTISGATVSASAAAATIVPGSPAAAARIASPRNADSGSSSSTVSAPAAASAASSP